MPSAVEYNPITAGDGCGLLLKSRAVAMSLTCRVQYVDDTDPFEYSANVPEPQRAPPLHSFSLTLPLINQMAAVHRVLRAPHRVSPSLTLNFPRSPSPGDSSFLKTIYGGKGFPLNAEKSFAPHSPADAVRTPRFCTGLKNAFCFELLRNFSLHCY